MVTVSSATRVLRVTRQPPSFDRFGWEIRDADGIVVRSTATFRSRPEALADGENVLSNLPASPADQD